MITAFSDGILYGWCGQDEFEKMIFKCNDSWMNETLCIDRNKACDGIPQCPDGSDEDFDLCEEFFSPSATIKCAAFGIYNNYTIETKAIRCNRFVECADQSDEVNCNVDQSVFLVFTICGLTIILVISTIIIKLADQDDAVNHDAIHLEDLGDLCSQNRTVVKNATIKTQGTKKQKLHNQKLYQSLSKMHAGDKQEVFNCLKVSYT